MCTHVYGHKWSFLQGVTENARIEEAIVRVVKHDAKTFWHSSHWKVREAHPAFGWLMTTWTSRIMELMLHDFQGFQGWVRRDHGNCHPVFLVGTRALGDVSCNEGVSTTLTLPCGEATSGPWLTAPVECLANSNSRLPAMRMNHVGWPARWSLLTMQHPQTCDCNHKKP